MRVDCEATPAGPVARCRFCPSTTAFHCVVLDHNRARRDVVEQTLVSAGHVCTLASTPEEALAATEARAPAALVVACDDDVAGARDVVARLRAAAARRWPDAAEFPVLALRSSRASESVDRDLDGVAHAALSARLDPQELLCTLCAFLGPQRQLSRQPAPGFAPPPAPVAAPPPIDMLELGERCLGDISLARRLVAAFAEELPTYVTALEDHLRSADGAQLQMMAHRLKGGAANMAATLIASIAARLEQLAAKGALEHVAAELAGLRAEQRRLQEFVDERAGAAAREPEDRV